MIILYFSGHGGMIGKTVGIYPYDYSGDRRDIITDVDIREILDKSKAKHKLCFIEACRNSPDREVVSMDIVDQSVLMDLNERRSKFRSGLAYISSSSEGQLSSGNKLSGGYFSNYLIKGLEGEADYDRDRFITIKEIFMYVKENVMLETENEQVPQINYSKSYDEETPIMKVPKVIIEPEPSKPCEINQVGDVCIINNSSYGYLYIVANNKVLPIKQGEQECIYDVPVGIFKFRAVEDRPGGASYCLGCYNADFEVRVIACETVTKKIK
jgi:hypothetical protein